MDSTIITTILTTIITSLGILIGFLLIFIQFLPNRKRRIKDIYREKLLDLSIKHFKKTDITLEEKITKKYHDSIDAKDIKVKILGKDFSLISLNLIAFTITIVLFSLSLLCLTYSLCLGRNIHDEVVYGIIGFTIFNYFLLIPITYLNCVKDYELQ